MAKFILSFKVRFPPMKCRVGALTVSSVAVIAFKAVYTLETKRRNNDAKVIALFVEMRDMIGVLLQYGVLASSVEYR